MSQVDPNVINTEESLLGLALSNNEVAYSVFAEMDENMFFTRKHKRVANAMFTLYRGDSAFDQGPVIDLMAQRGVEDAREIVRELMVNAGSPSSTEKYIQMVQDAHYKRQLVDALGDIRIEINSEETNSIAPILDMAQNRIMKIGKGLTDKEERSLQEVADNAFHSVVEAKKARDAGETPLNGIPTGFKDLDEMLSGWEDSKLYYIAGRPSMGKTSLVLSSIRRMAKLGYGTSVFSLEMSRVGLTKRLMSADAKVNMQRAEQGFLGESEIQRLNRSRTRIGKLPIHIHEGDFGVMEIRSMARVDVREHDVDAVVVDYMQLMSGPASANSREQEIAHISRQLKLMAGELDVPVIALSQLNRSVEKRGGDKRPRLSDLRESGAMEQDADAVMFVYRAERYGIEHHDILDISSEGIADILMRKQRNGPIGSVYLEFLEDYSMFVPLELNQNGGTPVPDDAFKTPDEEIRATSKPDDDIPF